MHLLSDVMLSSVSSLSAVFVAFLAACFLTAMSKFAFAMLKCMARQLATDRPNKTIDLSR